MQEEFVRVASLIVSNVALIAATFVQLRSMVRRSVPAIFLGWGIWTGVNIVSFMAQKAAGSTFLELSIPFVQSFSTFALGCMALWTAWRFRKQRDQKDKDSRFWSNIAVIVACAIGYAIWQQLGDPMWSIVFNVAANLAGLFPIWREGKKFPQQVTRLYWILRGVASITAGIVFLRPETIHLAGFIPQATGVFMCMVMVGVSFRRKKSV